MNIAICMWGLKSALLVKNAWFHNSSMITILIHSNKGLPLQLHKSDTKGRTHSCGLLYSGNLSDFFIMLISVNHTNWLSYVCVSYDCFWTSLEKKIAPASHLCVRLCGKGQNWWRWWGQRYRDGVLMSSISTRWWVYASSLPRGPAAMTSYPSTFAFIHFTFIRTSNDFPPMTGREEDDETLVGEKWNLHPALPIEPAFRKCCKGIYRGHAGQGQQSFSPFHVHTHMALCSWHSSRLKHT